MTKKRTQDPWMSGAEYGRRMPPLTFNLIVADVARSVRFYADVLGAEVEFSDVDFAAVRLAGVDFMLHADHTYDGHPVYERLAATERRGVGVELRALGVDPDDVLRRAEAFGAEIVQPVRERGHGWREVMVADPDGYVWAVGTLLPQ
jgi:uncharacterized glyoxalase superfamily protein PhnB